MERAFQRMGRWKDGKDNGVENCYSAEGRMWKGCEVLMWVTDDER